MVVENRNRPDEDRARAMAWHSSPPKAFATTARLAIKIIGRTGMATHFDRRVGGVYDGPISHRAAPKDPR
jgi:hypothetical protein